MQNDKLLPCPFCGGEAQPTFLCNGRYNQIKCKTPKCIMNVDLPAFYRSKEEAIKYWNTRKPMERIVEQIGLLDFKTHRVTRETGINSEVFETVRVDKYVRLDEVFDIVRNGGKE